MQEQLKHSIEQLSQDEKLTLVEDVWDSISLAEQQRSLEEWQKNELDSRAASELENPQALHD
ncbi:MAG TPA: addiction module protein [Oceanospirillaceae bacterium]|mgnify:CR=1 FL=1|nr:addiction module protein [Oceanospirillaceae bacterium]